MHTFDLMTYDLQLLEMNALELARHQLRAAAWVLQDQRAKELAAKQVIEDAQAKIEEFLRQPAAAPAETGWAPEKGGAPDMPLPTKPLPVDDGDAGG
jgi:hypothetical protein